MTPNKELFKYIKKRGTLIGSRAWGGYTMESDWDFAVSRRMFDRIMNKVDSLGINYQCYAGISENPEPSTRPMRNSTNVKIQIDDITVNLIGYENDIWNQAKDVFVVLDDISVSDIGIHMTRRSVRICLMETLMGVVAEAEPGRMPKDKAPEPKKQKEPEAPFECNPFMDPKTPGLFDPDDEIPF